MPRPGHAHVPATTRAWHAACKESDTPFQTYRTSCRLHSRAPPALRDGFLLWQPRKQKRVVLTCKYEESCHAQASVAPSTSLSTPASPGDPLARYNSFFKQLAWKERAVVKSKGVVISSGVASFNASRSAKRAPISLSQKKKAGGKTKKKK